MVCHRGLHNQLQEEGMMLNFSATVMMANGTLDLECNGTMTSTNQTKFVPTMVHSGWYLFMLVVIMAVTVFGNGIIIVVFMMIRRLRTTFNYFIFNLAIADFFVGCVAMPGFIIYNMYEGIWPAGRTFCTIWMEFDWGITFESNTTIAAMSLDRWWSVRFPLHYKNHRSKRLTFTILLLTWIWTHIAWLPGYVYDRVVHIDTYREHECSWDFNKNYDFTIPLNIMGYFLPLGIMTVCNMAIARIMWKRMKNSAPMNNAFGAAENTAKQKLTRDRKRLGILLAMTLSALICWAPWVSYFTVEPHFPGLMPGVIVTVGYWMCYLNSTINPYLYIATSEEFRRAYKQAFPCFFRRRKVRAKGLWTTSNSTVNPGQESETI